MAGKPSGAGQTGPRSARAKAIAVQQAFATARSRGARWALLAALAASWGRRVGHAFVEEASERRLFHWIPVAMGAGILLYFAADGEPALWYPLLLFVIFAGLAIAARHKPQAFVICVALASAFAGFVSVQGRTLRVAAPRLEKPVYASVAGHIEAIDFRPDGARMLVRVTAFENRAREATPLRVRVTMRNKPTVTAGDHVTFKARLLPPPEPARPGAYDFGREAFFRSIGAVGSIPGPIVASTGPPAPLSIRFFAGIDRKRNELTERIMRAYGGQGGALAAALVTGKRDLITEPTNDALRAAGVYHIVSVSGLHMVLAAGAFFWTARALLSLWMEMALRLPVKKIAAMIAMAGATAYCLFTGSDVATERSLIMILVMLGAVLADRPALSMRNLAISAIVVLLREPETVMGPSFQMSFAAVAALIAGSEWYQRHRRTPEDGPSDWFSRFTRHIWLAIAGTIATTLLATLATAPFAAFHFQRLNPLGLIGNAAALPFVSLIVMPSAVAGTLLWPLGLDGPVWWLMGAGAAPVIGISKTIEAMSGSVRGVYAFGTGAMLLMALAICWATLWFTWIRWLFIAPALIGLGMAARAKPPDMFIDRSGQGAAFFSTDGRLTILGQPSSFTSAFWLQAAGDLRRTNDATLRAHTRCDLLGCTGTDASGRILAWVKDARAFPEDCSRAHLIITPLQVPDWCNDPMIADRKTLTDYGAMTVRWHNEIPAITGKRDPHTRRPWQPQFPPEPAAPVRDNETRPAQRPALPVTALPEPREDAPPMPDDAPALQ
ncbi:MAG: ComEC/Rec2 family competence protein [Beijerinckiaceae bacterium]